MTYYPGGNGQPAQGDHPEINTTLAIHMCCALLAFVFLFPIGASVALGHDRLSGSVCWYIFHLIFHIAGTIAVIMLATTGYLYVADYGGNQNFAYNHEILGTAVFAAAILQMLLSPLRPAVYVGVAESNARLCWFWTHRILGAFVLFGGLANVLLGPQMLRDVVVGNADTYVINGRQFNTYQTFTYVIARATRPVRTHGVLELYTHARTHAALTPRVRAPNCQVHLRNCRRGHFHSHRHGNLRPVRAALLHAAQVRTGHPLAARRHHGQRG